MGTLHFIAGLPRSGSTLLVALLNQNPDTHAAIQTPLYEVFRGVLQTLSSAESALCATDSQRRQVLQAVLASYYKHLSDKRLIFDSHRAWPLSLAAIADLLPTSRVVCCVRNPAWIIDSIERIVQANPLRVQKLFNYEVGSVFTRAETLATRHLLGPSLNALRQAWCGEFAQRLILVRYESLVSRPQKVMDQLYTLVGQPGFAHNFENINYEATAFDERLGLPGLHTVRGPVRRARHESVLPAELFAKYDSEFWAASGNPHSVQVL